MCKLHWVASKVDIHPEVYWSVNYIGSLAKLTWTQCSLHFDKPQKKNESHSLNKYWMNTVLSIILAFIAKSRLLEIILNMQHQLDALSEEAKFAYNLVNGSQINNYARRNLKIDGKRFCFCFFFFFFFLFSGAGKFFLSHRIRIYLCFTWTDNSFLTYETEFYFSGAGNFFLAYQISISACFTWTDRPIGCIESHVSTSSSDVGFYIRWRQKKRHFMQIRR